MRSLQHHGSYTLSLILHFGNKNISETIKSKEDSIYFSPFLGVLINYSYSLVMPLTIILGLLLIFVCILGFKNKRIKVSGISLGFISFFLSVIFVSGLTYGIWQLIVMFHSEYQAMYYGRVYNAHLYLAAFAALTVAAFTSIYFLLRKKFKAGDLIIGASIVWYIFALTISLILPGMSYLFVWPLFFSLISTGIVFAIKKDISAKIWFPIMLTSSVVPAVIIFAPSISIMFQFTPTTLIAIPVFFTAILMGICFPIIELLKGKFKWYLPGIALIISIGFLISGTLTAGFNKEHPKQNAVAYMLNATTNKAYWFSPNIESDEYAAQFLTSQIEKGTLGELFPVPLTSRQKIVKSEAPVIHLEIPQFVVLEDTLKGDDRIIKVFIKSKRNAPVLEMDIRPSLYVKTIQVNDGEVLTVKPNKIGLVSVVFYTPSQEGIELTLVVDGSQELNVQIFDKTWELPTIPGKEFNNRSDDMIPMPNFDYGTIVVDVFKIN